MPVLQLDDQQFPLSAGANRIGAGAGADITVPGYSDLSVEAVIDGGASPTIRRAEESAHVRVNGVLLGAEPTPLMHGDKIEVAGLELRYADDSKGGATQFVSASEIAAIAGAKRTGAARATAASGGRLVSLVDGKEYSVPASGLVLGRDASCDVVVAQSEVSRRHAEIVPGDDGYTLRDMSANGLYVNGERVQGSLKLARADVVRLGTEEFRFYADVLQAAPKPVEPSPVTAAVETVPSSDLLEMDLLPIMSTASVAPAAVPTAMPVPVAATAPAPILAPLAPPAMPVAKDLRPVLAVLESTNEGPGKGTQYELRSSLGHVGRGAHNDVRLSDESVSETHAKLQKRDDGWYVVDMDSTNGTYVGGSRVSGERKLEGSPDVRFGGLKFQFTAVGAGSAAELEIKGTRAIAAMPKASTTAAPAVERESAPSAVPLPAPVARGGVPAWIWIIAALVVVAAVAFFMLKGRA
ncbi:MAG: FHA domain-containing protein [Polaromonas sp.]|nr:FHA domain-containing protein [Gemmatimonadaceae bacterium]